MTEGLTANAKRIVAQASSLVGRMMLAQRAGLQYGGRRDMYKTLGYLEREPRYEDYRARYDRQDIAKRIVDAPAMTTWRKRPDILDDVEREDDEDQQTDFEQAWEALAKRLKVYHYLERVDRLAGIGRYAVLLIGLRGQTNLGQPINTATGPDDVLYLSPFSEDHATIQQWEVDPESPRFGRPLMYRIQLSSTAQSFGFSAQTLTVHHSRLLHVSEGLLEDEVYGEPRLRAVFNRLMDLEKVAGGSAEMFWRGAERGLSIEVDKDAELKAEDAERMDDEIDQYLHDMRRYMRLQGATARNLGTDVANPTGHFDVIINLISATTRIPKRILLGSERGELASSQDENNWLSFVAERQEVFAEPMVLRPLIDKLIEIGALPTPTGKGGSYTAEWPDLFPKSDKEKGDAALSWARAIRELSGGVPETLVSPETMRERYLELPSTPPEPVESDDEDETNPQVMAQFKSGRLSQQVN